MQTDFSHSLKSRNYMHGDVIDTSIQQIDSYIADEELKYGQLVEYVADLDDYRRVKKINADNDNVVGVVVRSNYANFGSQLETNGTGEQAIITNSTEDGYAKGSLVPIMSLGRIAIKVDAVTSTQSKGTNFVWFHETNSTFNTSSVTQANTIKVGRVLETPAVGKIIPCQVNKMTNDGAIFSLPNSELITSMDNMQKEIDKLKTEILKKGK